MMDKPVIPPSSTVSSEALLSHDVKMVIWDLDETFWDGTLTEGGARPRADTLQIVRTLAERGIISSICSKNNLEDAKRELERYGVWEYFVFPKIGFVSKGPEIAAIIEQANLRASNILFIDDNRLNLEEVRHFAPGIMTADPRDILPVLLDLPQVRGKNDLALSRLRQYKQLEEKSADIAATTLNAADFLRGCDIKVKLSYEIDTEFGRIVELINRSNQLNYTKKRVETDRQIAEFRKLLDRCDAHAGTVTVSDRYGDYGVVGFFLVIKDAGIHRLEHFVFSCRAMNMGVEQFVYDRLGAPDCVVVDPVANQIRCFDRVDWISEIEAAHEEEAQTPIEKVLLLGGCDLLQVASYCSKNRVEYVNFIRNGVEVRYDDFGFILNQRGTMRNSAVLPTIPCWTLDEALTFDQDLSRAQVVIASLWVALRGKYFVTDDGVVVRVHPDGLGHHIDHNPGQPFMEHVKTYGLSDTQCAELIRQSLDLLAQRSPRAAYRVVLGCNTRSVNHASTASDARSRRVYNRIAARYAAETGRFDFISIDDLVPRNELTDDWHLSRMGYFRVAREVLRRRGNYALASASQTAAPGDIARIVSAGTPVQDDAKLGIPVTTLQRVKRAIKKAPGGNLAVEIYRHAFPED